MQNIRILCRVVGRMHLHRHESTYYTYTLRTVYTVQYSTAQSMARDLCRVHFCICRRRFRRTRDRHRLRTRHVTSHHAHTHTHECASHTINIHFVNTANTPKNARPNTSVSQLHVVHRLTRRESNCNARRLVLRWRRLRRRMRRRSQVAPEYTV